MAGVEDLTDRASASRRVTLVGALANVVLSAVKIVLGTVGHSEALIVDGVHSLSDLLSDGLVFLALYHAGQAPDEEHPYGHGRFETVATFALGVLLLLVAAGIAWDAMTRLFDPHRLLIPTELALYGALLSIVVKEALYHYTMVVGRRVRSPLLRANAWHHRSDAVSSIVVLVGVAGTMAGLPYLDAVGAVLVGVMIGKIGWTLGWEAVHELVDAGLEQEKLKTIRETILGVGGVRNLHMLRTRRLGGHASADVHVQVEPRLTVSEGHQIAVLVEERLKREIDEIEDVTVHIDPEDDETADSCRSLMPRAQALQQIDHAWQDVRGAAQRTNVTLHYLAGRIDVDVCFPVELACNPAQRDRREQALGRALKRSQGRFGRLKVFYGGCTILVH
jgi:cation diffusion facilitator family transporter